MSRLERPKNDWSKTLWILNQSYMGGVNMTKVLTHFEPTFWKFQTRLGEVIHQYPKLKIQKTYENTRQHFYFLTSKKIYIT